MIDLRDHGGSFGGGKYRKGSYINFRNLDLGVNSPPIKQMPNKTSVSYTDGVGYARGFFKFPDGKMYTFYSGLYNTTYSWDPAVWQINPDTFDIIGTKKDNIALGSVAVSCIPLLDRNCLLFASSTDIILYDLTTFTTVWKFKASGVFAGVSSSARIASALKHPTTGLIYLVMDGVLVQFDIDTRTAAKVIPLNGGGATPTGGSFSEDGNYFWFTQSTTNATNLYCLKLSDLTVKNFAHSKNSGYTSSSGALYHNGDVVYLVDTFKYQLQKFSFSTMFDGRTTSTDPTPLSSLYHYYFYSPYTITVHNENGMDILYVTNVNTMFRLTADLSQTLDQWNDSWVFGASSVNNGGNGGRILIDNNDNFWLITNSGAKITQVFQNVKILA